MKKQVKILTTVIILLLVVIIAAGGVLLWRVHSTLKEQTRQKEALQNQVDELETELEALRQQETSEDISGDEEGAQEDLENLAKPEVVTPEPLDMEHIPAGTLITQEQVDGNNLTQYFCSYSISDEIYQRINGKSYRENNDIGLEQLRYLKVLHYNFDHQLQMGELIVNADLAEDYLNIFRELFEAEYEIQSMYLIDNYWTGDGGTSDTASIEENNTSAFCYRTITGGTSLSNHALGRAIDINPQQNPYVSYSSGSPVWYHSNANDYIDRTTGLAHVIDHNDICYQIFTKYGFSWGGDWNSVKDYQHFEKE